MHKWFGLAITSLAFVAFGAAQASADVIFSDDFNSGASSDWSNQFGNWTTSNGAYYAQNPSSSPNAYSALNFNLADFVVSFDMNNARDGGIWLRGTPEPYSSGTTPNSIGMVGVLLVVGGDGNGSTGSSGTGLYWHVVTDPNNSYPPQLDNSVPNVIVPGSSDIHVTVVVSGDTYSAYVNGVLETTLVTGGFADGVVALYDNSSYDNSMGQSFDNLVISSIPEPSSLSLIAIGGLGLLFRRKRPNWFGTRNL